MRKRIIGIVLCLALMCMLFPCAFASEGVVYFNPTGASSWAANSDNSWNALPVSIKDSTSITIPSPNPIRTGYTFKGWGTVINDESSISINATGAGNTYSLSDCKVDDGDTLYAIWEADTTSNTTGSTTAATGTGMTVSADTSAVTLSYLIKKSSGGNIEGLTDLTNIPEGSTVYIVAQPKQNYEIKSVEVFTTAGKRYIETTYSETQGDPTYSFTMPNEAVTAQILVNNTSASSITLDKSTMSLTTFSSSNTGTITATLDPTTAKVSSWTSSNTAVATVTPSTDMKSCTVTAVSGGTATITATSGTQTATCAVTVTGNSLSINVPSKFVDTATYKAYATANPSTEPITWTSSDTSVLTVKADNSLGTEATIQPLKTGTAVITASIGTKAAGTYLEKSQSVTVSLSTQKYKVISNGNGCWYYDAPSSYQIIVNAPYTTGISSVSIYDSQTGKTYYPVIGTDVTKQYDTNYPNQTILTFTQAFMQTLPRHTYMVLTVKFADGTASTYLHILSATGRPITGDIKFNPYWVVLALGATGMGAALTLRKKEANK